MQPRNHTWMVNRFTYFKALSALVISLEIILGAPRTQPIQLEEKELLSQKEEYFRYRDTLKFQLPSEGVNGVEGGLSSSLPKENFVIDCMPIHKTLYELESQCSDVYINNVKTLIKSCPKLEENLNVWQQKNLAVFGTTLIVKVKDKYKTFSATPIGVKEADKLTQKVFISGSRLPYIKANPHLNDRPIECGNMLQVKSGNYPLLSMSEAVKGIGSVENYIDTDLRQGFNEFGGVFQQDSKRHGASSWKDRGISICEHLKKITPLNTGYKIGDQFTGTWGGSLVDSEQAIRIYFQENIEEIIKKIINSFAPEEKANSRIMGIVLHIHSKMDVCEICTASLLGFMENCNEHYSASGRQIAGKRSYVLENILKGISSLKMSGDFRMRITVSSREPYLKWVKVARRNWSGLDQISLIDNANQVIDFKTAKILFHTVFSERLKIYPKLLSVETEPGVNNAAETITISKAGLTLK